MSYEPGPGTFRRPMLVDQPVLDGTVGRLQQFGIGEHTERGVCVSHTNTDVHAETAARAYPGTLSCGLKKHLLSAVRTATLAATDSAPTRSKALEA